MGLWKILPIMKANCPQKYIKNHHPIFVQRGWDDFMIPGFYAQA
jgi:hypothetical protein